MTRASIVERLMAIYGNPNTENPELFLSEFEQALAGTDERLLHKAIDEGMKSWQFFPRPSEVLTVLRRQNPPARVEKFKDWQPPQMSPEGKERCRSLMANLMVTLKSSGHVSVDETEKRKQAFQRTQCAPGAAINAWFSRKDQAAGERDE
jgi:hypothetical protein